MLELIVVIAIIAILVGFLVPVIRDARREAWRLQCQGNLRDLGQALYAYAGENNGWLYPVVNAPGGGAKPGHGTIVAPHERWPARVYELASAGAALPYDPDSYTEEPYDPEAFPTKPFTPASLLCPNDEDPCEGHSYVLNGHLATRGYRLGGRDSGGHPASAIVLAGEKRSLERDYYVEANEFDHVVEPFRHGQTKGSNYLFVDGHVETQLPGRVMGGMDPWDLNREK